MTRLAFSLALLAATALGAADTRAQRAPDISGRWATAGVGSIVEFSPCTADTATLCGRIVWLWEPLDSRGRQRTDRRNPDATLRSRPLVGVEIVRGLRQTGPGVWGEGSLYNPDDGRTYAGTVRLLNGALELRGCALNVICQSQTWRRTEQLAAILKESSQ